jgi:hypothetical protein
MEGTALAGVGAPWPAMGSSPEMKGGGGARLLGHRGAPWGVESYIAGVWLLFVTAACTEEEVEEREEKKREKKEEKKRKEIEKFLNLEIFKVEH